MTVRMAQETKMKKKLMIGLSCSILLCILVLNSDNDLIGRIAPFSMSSANEDISCYDKPCTSTAMEFRQPEGTPLVFFFRLIPSSFLGCF